MSTVSVRAVSQLPLLFERLLIIIVVKTPMTQHLQDNAAINAHLGAMHPWAGGGLGEPDAIAKAALFLASDEAQWVTGVALPVDGGYVVQ